MGRKEESDSPMPETPLMTHPRRSLEAMVRMKRREEEEEEEKRES
jgi:hypothetical protein